MMMRHRINTDEQNEIIHSPSSTIIVNAFAGTGKTTTLVDYAKMNPDKTMLYLAFNKAIADEAVRKFPDNVEAKTSHSLAYAKFGSQFRSKLGEPKAYQLKTALGLTQVTMANSVLKTLKNFMASADFEISDKHIELNVRPENRGAVLKHTKKAWDMMIDRESKTIRMPHDGYLKLYQLAKPTLRSYDVLLLDEAQDTNPCLFQVFQNQKGCKVLVGDTHQNIYGFRGSMDAMKSINGDVFTLSNSFRFGHDIAEMANLLLSKFKDEKKPIKGHDVDSVVTTPQGINPRLETCYLTRTNAALFDVAVRLMKIGIKPINFVGGIDNYSFDLILDAHYLHRDNKDMIKNPFIKTFNSIEALEGYAFSTEDHEISSRVKVAKKYLDEIPELVTKLKTIHKNKSNVSLTTAHKAKGLEWEQVVIGNDFADLSELASCHSHMLSPEDQQEINLIYVSMTRAKKSLILNSSLRNFMDSQQVHLIGEKYIF